MSKKMIIGLTGPTGSGKSTVAGMLKDVGFGVVDSDVIAREITVQGSPVMKKLKEHFGKDIFNSDGSLNRGELAKFAFASQERTDTLNRITHPYITERILEEIDKNFAEGVEAVIIDAAALFESGFNEKCDFCVCVISPDYIRLERIMSRDGIDEESALLRINAQKDENYYKENADIILRNFPPYNLEKEVSVLVKKINRKIREMK